MDRINICRACQNEAVGAKTRIEIPHTCQDEEPKETIVLGMFLLHRGVKVDSNGNPIRLMKQYKIIIPDSGGAKNG